jgi:hypothetical protein
MTTPPTTLHERLAAELARRTAVANAATSGPWTNADPMARDGVFAEAVDGFVADCGYERMGPFAVHNAAHIALHDPADALRRYAGELEVLERHAPTGNETGVWCAHCLWLPGRDQPRLYPCPEIKSLASRLGVSVDG